MSRFFAPLARWAATLTIVVLATLVALWLWRRYEADPWTRDGHVRADVVRVTADVGGLITQVSVRDNQPVKAGQLLFVVDRPRYAAALAQADAAIASARASLDLARKEARRDIALGDLVATETHEQNVAKVETADAALAQAQAARATAALNVARTEVRASVNGVVTNLDLHPGDFLAPGAQAMALVDSDSIRIEGYFEETKLGQIQIGDKVRIRLMGDKNDLLGHVDSISAGISDDQRGDSRNLLPTVQPTFAWVRLAQRIPVRIHIDRMPAGTQLIAGRTATVTILPRASAPTAPPAATATSPAPAPAAKR